MAEVIARSSRVRHTTASPATRSPRSVGRSSVSCRRRWGSRATSTAAHAAAAPTTAMAGAGEARPVTTVTTRGPVADAALNTAASRA
ncbi:hypothetical protein [Microbispora sp. CA-102843]|uniref:hypothetical protein n=1 Tax=Microbispora sp. CA-102843 TaxID=3239952 RepID=UPI003D8C615E